MMNEKVMMEESEQSKVFLGDQDVSCCKVTAEGAIRARTLSEITGQFLSVTDFVVDKTPQGHAEAFIAADNALHVDSATDILLTDRNTVMEVYPSHELSAANHTVVLGRGQLSGFVRKQSNAKHLPTSGPSLKTILPEQLKNFHNACAKGTARVCIMGDSIMGLAGSIISTSEGPAFALIDELKKQNPGVNIELLNCALGGTTWADGWNDTTQPPVWFDNDKKLNWKEFVCDYNPDLLLLYWGGNDSLYDFNVVSMQKLIKFFTDENNYTSHKAPSIVLGVTYNPSLGSTLLNYNLELIQNSVAGVSGYVRSYAIAHNIAYLDFNRRLAIVRDGIDPREISLERVQASENSDFSAYEEPICVNNSVYTFPAVRTENGILANSCTDWLFCCSISNTPKNGISFNLSDLKPTSSHPSGNMCYIIPVNGKITVVYTDGVNKDITGINGGVTDIDWPENGSSWIFTIKDNRLRIEIRQPIHTGANIDNRGAHITGMGYVCIFDDLIVRYGGHYTPYINFGGATNIIIHNFCIGDNTRIQTSGHRSSCQRYRPIISDHELYVAGDETFGGSDSYHMNTYGYRLVMSHVIREQNWASPLFPVIPPIADLTDAPTKEDFNNLLGALRRAGLMSFS